MKHHSLLIFFILTLFACVKDGEIEPTDYPKLLRVENYDGERYFIDEYVYDQNDVLVEFLDAGWVSFRYKFDYLGKRIVKMTTNQVGHSKSTTIRKFIYNSYGRIGSIRDFNADSDSNRIFIGESKFIYDSKGQLSSMTSRYGADLRHSEFIWKKGNMIHRKGFVNGNLSDEEFFEYDDQNNYRRLNPAFLLQPQNWSRNNVIASGLVDHTNLIDIVCYPCMNSYEYNQMGYPTSIEKDWGYSSKLFYK